MHHPLEVVAVDSIESHRHQCCPDGTNGVFGKGIWFGMLRMNAKDFGPSSQSLCLPSTRRLYPQLLLPNAALIRREVSSMDQRDTFEQFQISRPAKT